MEVDKSNILLIGGATFILFELMKQYNFSAPSLAVCRAASNDPNNVEYIDVKTQLNDADITIGSVALVVSLVFSLQTKDYSIFILTVVSLAMLSLWRHKILSSSPTTLPR